MKNQDLIAVWISEDKVFGGIDGADRVVIGKAHVGDEIMTLKGVADEFELCRNVTYRFYGAFRNHPTWGRQFWFSSFVEDEPADKDSFIAYMTRAHLPARGSVTNRIAELLWERFGDRCIDVIINSPVMAAENVKRWGADKAAIASEYFRIQDSTRKAKLAVISLVSGRGFPKRTVDLAVKNWGAEAAEMITEDPYILTEIPGIGFLGADKLQVELAAKRKEPERLTSIKRQAMCGLYELKKMADGSTWYPKQMVMARIKATIGSKSDPEKAMLWLEELGYIEIHENEVAEKTKAIHEFEIARGIWAANQVPSEWPDIDDIIVHCEKGREYTDHQRQAVIAATSKRVGCLQGAPGTGKTTCIAAIVKAILSSGRSVAACAPTGKASVRVTQSFANLGVQCDAMTTHRLLGVVSADGSGWRFVHNETNKLPVDFLVCDEESMKDTDLMASLIRACSEDTHILLVGDADQLAPVGHGKPFLDLQSVVPTGRLTEIHRNSGRIVKACAEIRDRATFSSSRKIDLDAEDPENLAMMECGEDEQIMVMNNVIEKLSATGVDVTWDCQVITALNDKSPVSRNSVNTILQKKLNQHGEPVERTPFRIGDKVVCLKNGVYEDAYERGFAHGVSNGEIGELVRVNFGKMIIKVPYPDRTVVVPIFSTSSDSKSGEEGAVSNWDLGYAISCHKSQGSQWKHVVVLVDQGSRGRMVQNRNWVYTAISRAEIAAFVVGRRSAVQAAILRDGISSRRTKIIDRYREIDSEYGHKDPVGLITFSAEELV